MNDARFAYVTYIAATPEKVWDGLINPKMTSQYWMHDNESDWRPGSKWAHRRNDKDRTTDIIGKVIEFTPPSRLVISWASPDDEDQEDQFSRVTFAIEPTAGVVCLTVTHEGLEPNSEMLEGITDGWPKVLSSLKTLLETGKPLPELW